MSGPADWSDRTQSDRLSDQVRAKVMCCKPLTTVAGSMTAQPPGIRPSALRVATHGQQVAPLVQSTYSTAPADRALKVQIKVYVLMVQTKVHVLKVQTKVPVLKLQNKIHVLKVQTKVPVLKLQTKVHVLMVQTKVHVLKVQTKVHVLKVLTKVPVLHMVKYNNR